jgi:PAS domain S-box-containing protein
MNENEIVFQNLVEQTANPFFILKGEDMVLELANSAVFNLWKVGEEAIGKPLLEIFPELKNKPIVSWLSEVYKTGISHIGNEASRQLKLENGDTETQYFNYIYQPFRAQDNSILGIIVFAYNVTQQVTSRKYQESRENWYKTLIQSLPVAVYTCDKNGYIQLFNNAASELWGAEPQIGVDRWCGSFRPRDADGVPLLLENSPMAVILQTGTVLNGVEIIMERPDGNRSHVLNYPQLIFDEVGAVTGAINTLIDISEQKIVEIALTEAKVFAEMTTMVAEESRLKAQHATLLAEGAVKTKQQFLSNMSHEIRTPMNAIIGFAKVMMKTALTAKQKEYLSAIKISGDALIVLINDILDLAKVDAGKMIFEETPFKMSVTLPAMLHLFELKIKEKNLLFVQEYDPNIPSILLGDPVRLHQIILNLVSNAIKFTSTGKITVGVQFLTENSTHAEIGFSVSDTGIGIPEDQIGAIFENFQQASSGTVRLYGGTGLGLAIAKQLVEHQGGSIQVESKLGVGSTFSFKLKFQKASESAALESILDDLDSDIKNIKVLIVEDMPLNQLLMKTLLDDFGFERDIADNGRIAIEKLHLKTYDIILMDLQMPEMNGYEATEYIRNTMHSKIPIIALTADVTTTDLIRCKEAGMDDYISKPVDERLLYGKIVGLVMKPLLKKAPKHNSDVSGAKFKYTDLKYLIQRTRNDPDMIRDMITAYLEQTPPLIIAMKISLQNHDWESLHAAAHKMIPSFSIMGMSEDFEKMAKQVMEYARSRQQLDSISEMVSQLETACTQACQELESEINRFKSIIS